MCMLKPTSAPFQSETAFTQSFSSHARQRDPIKGEMQFNLIGVFKRTGDRDTHILVEGPYEAMPRR